MAIEFIGAFVAAIGMVGVMLFVNRVLLRGFFGRWIYPAAAGAGLLAFTLWAEYSWPARALAVQPGLRLATANEVSLLYRPWTLIWPQSTRIVAVSSVTTLTHPEQPDLVLTQVVLLSRWEALRAFPMVFDCARNAGAELAPGVSLNADGTLEGAGWSMLEADDAVLRTACAVREEVTHERGGGA